MLYWPHKHGDLKGVIYLSEHENWIKTEAELQVGSRGIFVRCRCGIPVIITHTGINGDDDVCPLCGLRLRVIVQAREETHAQKEDRI